MTSLVRQMKLQEQVEMLSGRKGEVRIVLRSGATSVANGQPRKWMVDGKPATVSQHRESEYLRRHRLAKAQEELKGLR